MKFREAIKSLNAHLSIHQPLSFSSSWIVKYAPSSYRYFHKHVRTENNHIDWDRITASLGKRFQKRWMRYRGKSAKIYEDQEEVNRIFKKFRSRLYILLVAKTKQDDQLRNRIMIKLVRIAQRGNILATRELIKYLTFIIDEWIDRCYQIRKWKGYTDDIEEKIIACIRCYRYTGSFLGYLFKTLEYSGRGKAPIQKYSLDDPVGDEGKTRIDYLVQEESDSYV